MRTMFLILIGVVFVTTLVYAVLIWKQTVKIEKSALAAKKLKEEQMRKLGLENEMEIKKNKMAKDRDDFENAGQPGNIAINEENLD